MSDRPSPPIDELRVSPEFRRAAGNELLTALDAEQEVVYAVDRAMTLHFVNRGWHDFAIANEGARCIDDYVVGDSIDRAIPAVLKPFYRGAFDAVFAGGPPLDHLYECPSTNQQRSFRMRAARLVGGDFLIVSNQLVRQLDAGGADASEVVPEKYVGENGLVVQCAHCRRCRRVESEIWDWVPAYVAARSEGVSHGLCPSCFAHHYSGGDR